MYERTTSVHSKGMNEGYKRGKKARAAPAGASKLPERESQDQRGQRRGQAAVGGPPADGPPGRPQATTSGRGLWDRSVREMVSGCRTTFSTTPPVTQPPRTWPSSWTAIMPSQERVKVEAISTTWGSLPIGRPSSRGREKRPHV